MSYIEHYRQLAPTLPGSDLPWLQTQRQSAEARFAARGFPSTREEDWRYTPLAPLSKTLFLPAPSAATESALIDPYRLAGTWTLVFVDGHFVPGLSDLDSLPQSVTVQTVEEALAQGEPRLQSLLAASPEPSHGLTDFNLAYFRSGLFIHIPTQTVLDKPIHLLHLSTRPEGLTVLRHLIELGCHAEAQLIESWASTTDEPYLNVAATQLRLAENSQLDHAKLQTEGVRAFHYGGLFCQQAQSARFRQHHSALGGMIARTEIHAHLGEAADCELDGLFLATGRQHQDTQTLIRHAQPHARSREHYRGIAADRARGVFAGRILVDPKAQKTDSEMSSRNLLLSDGAEIDSKPQLEIHADDVKCSHGVTVGQLDAEAVFYLQSRGIDEASARTMLTFAFANEQVNKIGNEALRHRVRAALLASLPQSDIRGDWL